MCYIKMMQESIKNINECVRPGSSYLIKDTNSEKGFEIFTMLTLNNGGNGVCVSGIHPNDIRKRYDLDKVVFIWLTQNHDIKKNWIHPSNLSRLIFVLKNLLKENKNTPIFLEGLEHLFAHSNWETLMSFFYIINDVVAVNRTKMLVLMDPFALTKKQMVFLEDEMEELIL